MSFSKTAWSAIEYTYKAILEHPFNKELAPYQDRLAMFGVG